MCARAECLGNVEICGATVEPIPGAKDHTRTLGVRMTHPSWVEGGADVELFVEYADEDQFRAWKKELDRAVARKSVPGGRGENHLGWRKHGGSQSWKSRDSSSGGGMVSSGDSSQGQRARRKKTDDDDDDD